MSTYLETVFTATHNSYAVGDLHRQLDGGVRGLELEFCATPTSSPAWGLERKREGRVVRFWRVTASRSPDEPVQFPSTGTPEAGWYRRHLETTGGAI